MSKYMQIDIRLIPFYEKTFLKHFPNISDLLKSMSYTEPLEKEFSLYVLVDYLVGMTRDPKVPSDVKKRIGPYVQKMSGLKERARERLLSRRLNELDQLLYRIEDQFEDLESGL